MFVWAWIACALLIISRPTFSLAQQAPATMPSAPGLPSPAEALANSTLDSVAKANENPILGAERQLPDFSKRETFSSAMQIIILLTVLSLAPAILLMMTSFTRIVIVLSLLRQALGTQQLPPNQVLLGLSLFMTFLVMGPTMQKMNDTALQPYMNGKMSQTDALATAQAPVRVFMEEQIKRNHNESDVQMFVRYARLPRASSFRDVGTMTLVPAFMLSELKTAFLLGFQIYLPFVIIDMVISTVLVSMGMMMLPPSLISLPFKLLLFVLVDGWHLITSSLMGSFVT
jgi:flagellar biosynthetic protein FliP